VSSHALQQGGGRLFEGDTNRNRDDPLSRREVLSMIGTQGGAKLDNV